MKIKLHGGDCCGIKHIHGLGYYPSEKLAARKALKTTSFGQKHPTYGHEMNGGLNDMMSKNPKKNCDFFSLSAPMETYEARLRRFVHYIKDNRLHGVIEVVINSFGSKWKPVLEEIGFKAVSTGVNSNSNTYITIYHLVH